MAGNRKIRISQCMIVKNEEDNIERALSWGKGIVSEQIVVDTGSTDRTVEIAREMGARVYEFQWVDDFAAAKNFAISKARYEWIAFLDADEYFIGEDGKVLLEAVGQLHPTGAECLLTGWVNLNDQGKVMFVGSQCRVFKNIPAIRYHGRIHESLTCLDGHTMDTVDMVEELTIYHTGYGIVGSRKKEGRNLKLIRRELERDPDDYKMWTYLGQEYGCMEQWDEAEEAFRKGISLMPDSLKGFYDVISSMVYLRLLEILKNRPGTREEELREVYQEAIEGWPEEADYDYMMGRYYAAHNEWEKGEYHVRRALQVLETYGRACKSMIIAGEIEKAHELLAICCYNTGHLNECIQITTALLKNSAYLMSTLMVMLMAFARDREIQEKGRTGAEVVAAFLGNSFYNLQTLKDRIFILRAAMAADYQELVVVMREMFTAQELELVDQALSKG